MRTLSSVLVTITASLAVLGSMALAEQDRYTLKIPDGLAWSEFRGYENWENVAVSQTESSLKVIAANDVDDKSVQGRRSWQRQTFS